MINLNAMTATKDEYLNNIEKIKGAKVAGFMKEATMVLILGDQLVITTSRETQMNIVAMLVSQTLQLIARKYGISEDDSIPLLQDCEVMIKAVERAARSPVEAV